MENTEQVAVDAHKAHSRKYPVACTSQLLKITLCLSFPVLLTKWCMGSKDFKKMITATVERVREVDELVGTFHVIVADTEKEIVSSRPFFSIFSAQKFANACLMDSDVCEECNGTGEVDCMDYVYAGEPHMAMVGTRKCVCQSNNDEQ